MRYFPLIVFQVISQFCFGNPETANQINESIQNAENEASGQFFRLSEPVDFPVQQQIQDSLFNFSKLIFHTSTCFGSCPVIHLEISSDKSIKYSGNYFKDENFNEIDSARSGNFKGQLADELYDELYELIIQSKITELESGQNQILCCDGAIKTIILYHNDLRKYYQFMFEPKKLSELISFLYTMDQKVDLTKVEEKFTFEK